MARCSQRTYSLIIKASDTDVLLIAISVIQILNDIGLEKLWVTFGQGATLRWIPKHDIRHSIGSVKSKGLPFFLLLQAVMLFQLSMGKVKGLHGKRDMCILRLKTYLQSSICTHQ